MLGGKLVYEYAVGVHEYAVGVQRQGGSKEVKAEQNVNAGAGEL